MAGQEQADRAGHIQRSAETMPVPTPTRSDPCDRHDHDEAAATRLRDWLAPHRRVFVLTGAGCSTGSGIPDYRDADGAWKGRTPITWQAFTADPAARARYWARSFVGWPMVDRARPNPAHHALADAGHRGRLAGLVTQNVDGLHQRAGSVGTIDLHGRIGTVVCLQCGDRSARAALQARLHAANPEWVGLRAERAPDGDAELDGVAFDRFRIPHCLRCGGMLKPDVVFFGENVPRQRVADASAMLAAADAMLVVGSSLMVYSGYRFARAAGLPLAILTRGVTRADAIATLKLDADCARVLTGAV